MPLTDRVVGVYKYTGVAAVTYERLTLDLDGSMRLEVWLDLGGRWLVRTRGTFAVDGATVRLTPQPRGRHLDDEEEVFEPLHIRTLDAQLVLVPERHVAEFDDTGGCEPSWRERHNVPFARGYSVVVKQPLPRVVICHRSDVYGHALTIGKRYLALEENAERRQVRLFADHGRLRWFPRSCFEPRAEPGATGPGTVPEAGAGGMQSPRGW